jgi:hypothetical protein
LGQAVDAIKTYASSGDWQLQSVPRIHIGLEATLATAEQQHDLPVIDAPTKVPIDVPTGASVKLVR